jgi:hypothetical protein
MHAGARRLCGDALTPAIFAQRIEHFNFPGLCHKVQSAVTDELPGDLVCYGPDAVIILRPVIVEESDGSFGAFGGDRFGRSASPRRRQR